jgi:hypothetical protein
MRWLAVTVSIAVLVVGLTAQKQQQKSEAATVAFVVDWDAL